MPPSLAKLMLSVAIFSPQAMLGSMIQTLQAMFTALIQAFMLAVISVCAFLVFNTRRTFAHYLCQSQDAFMGEIAPF